MKRFTLIVGLLLTFLVQDVFAQPIGRRYNAVDLSTTEKNALAVAMLGYINLAIIEEHSCNNEFGNAQGAAGSIHGPEMFLNWHRVYLAEMEAALQTTLTVTIPQLNGLLPRWTHADLLTDMDPFLAIDPACAMACGSGSCGVTPDNDDPNDYPYNNWDCMDWTDFVDFSEDLQYGYHNQGHQALGGIMASFKSPATPIFWLWHGMIDDVYWDFQNSCIDQGDLYIKDTPNEDGNEPNNQSPDFYISEDIWIRNDQDTPTGITGIPHGSTAYMNEGDHQDPEYKGLGPNYIYVRVRNRNLNDEFAGGRLRVYWSKASTGLSWPETWINYDPDGTGLIYGDELTPTNPTVIDNTDPANPIFMAPVPTESNFVLPPIPPGGSFIVEIPWMVPNPLDYGTDDHHFCLLARVVSAYDDFAFQEGETLWQNVAENNNIAWKNVQIVDLDPSNLIDPNWNFNFQILTTSVSFNGVYTTNTSGNTQTTTLTFETGKNKKGPNFQDNGGVVVVKMDMDLYKAWLNGGALSRGVNRLGEYNGYFYAELTDPYALMENIDLPAKSNYYLAMGYALTKSIPDGEEYDYDVRQYNDRGFVGGERYEIRINTPKGDGGPGKVKERSDELVIVENSLRIAPNPATDQFTVMYTLETAQEVSMRLYDVSGRLVKQIASRDKTIGAQSQAVDATDLSKGIYLLKVQMGDKIMIEKVVVE